MINTKDKTGPTLKRIRKAKGITQVALSKEGTSNHICTIRHLRKIESGQIEPNAGMLCQLLAALGVSLPEFALQLFGEGMIQFENELEAVRNLFIEGQFDDAESRFDKLRDNEFFDSDNPRIVQSVLLIESMIMAFRHKEYQQCLKELYKALRITSQKIVTGGGLHYEFIANNALTISEYRLLMLVGTVEEVLGNKTAQIGILRALIASLDNAKIDSETKGKLLPAIYFNLSNALLGESDFDGVLDATNRGIAISREAKVFRAFGRLLWNKGCAHFYLDDKIAALEYFNKSFSCFTLLGYTETAEHLRKTAAEKYGIWLNYIHG